MGVALAFLAAASAAAQPDPQFEYLFALGSATGLNPPQRFEKGIVRRIFGPPDGVSPVAGPATVTVDPDERIWIADRRAQGVHMFNVLDGSYRFLRGAPRIRFQCPWGIDSDYHGRIYVVDSCLGQVFIFDSDSSFLRLLLNQRSGRILERPAALAVSADLKSIYVTDIGRHKVIVLNQEGESIREWGGPEELPMPIAVSVQNDRVYVLDADRHRVQVYSPAGKLLKSLAWDRVRYPSAFAIDAEQGLYFVGDPKLQTVQVFDEAGAPVGAFGQAGSGPGEMHAPSYIYVDAENRIYVVDPENAKVLVFRRAAPGALSSVLASSAAELFSRGADARHETQQQQNTLRRRKLTTIRKNAPAEGADQP